MTSEDIKFTKFTAEFLKNLDAKSSDVSSPLSVEILLGIIALGATGESHAQIMDALGFSEDSIRSTFSSVLSHLDSIKDVILDLANKGYVMKGFKLHPKLLKDANKIFGVSLEEIDFCNSETAAIKINTWVEDKSKKKIRDLISSNILNEATRLVLVNAVYFKGLWEVPFEHYDTRESTFHAYGGDIKVPIMHMEGYFQYGESQELNAKLLELPYQGKQSSMLIVLPNEIQGLDYVIEKLASGNSLHSEISKMWCDSVNLGIPKFKIESTLNLIDVLKKMGVNKIFDRENSGLTQMLISGKNTPIDGLFVSEAIQKTIIEVNEEGTEASVATGMLEMLCCARITKREFYVDRPALFFIMVRHLIVFAARYAPTESYKDTNENTVGSQFSPGGDYFEEDNFANGKTSVKTIYDSHHRPLKNKFKCNLQ